MKFRANVTKESSFAKGNLFEISKINNYTILVVRASFDKAFLYQHAAAARQEACVSKI